MREETILDRPSLSLSLSLSVFVACRRPNWDEHVPSNNFRVLLRKLNDVTQKPNALPAPLGGGKKWPWTEFKKEGEGEGGRR